MALRVDGRTTQKLVPHFQAYIAGRHAAVRDHWMHQARLAHTVAVRVDCAQLARRFHRYYLQELRRLP